VKGNYLVFVQPKFAVAWLVGIGFVSMLIVSCEPVQKHRVLTFFFDGVPPLEQGTATAAQGPQDPNLEVFPAERAPKPAMFVHEPRKNCEICHSTRQRRGFSRTVQLTAEVPELCHQCHADYTKLEEWVHGSVAVGECLFCHHHHESRNKHLLKKPVPTLCYLCHEREQIAAIPDHSEQAVSACLDCHEGHSSLSRSLLREDWKEKADWKDETEK
jgi:predicted CXXCH cytochrome family protein